MAEITSTSNQRVKLARKLQRKRHREQVGLCLLEGLRLVRDAWKAGAAVDTLFYTAAFGGDVEGRRLLEAMQAAGVAAVSVTDEVLAAVTETVTPQGIAALVALPQLAPPTPTQFILIFDRLRDPGNAGTLLRSAAAAGVDLVLFGAETVDPFNDKVLRAAMGAHFRLPLRVCTGWDEIGTFVGDRSLYVADAGGSLRYDQVNWTLPTALVVGGEATGAGAAALRQGTSIFIPMQQKTESLNAAVAGSVILFEAARQRRNALLP